MRIVFIWRGSKDGKFSIVFFGSFFFFFFFSVSQKDDNAFPMNEI